MIVYEPKPIKYKKREIPTLKKISGPKDIVALVADIFDSPYEKFVVIYLNVANIPIIEIESVGAIDHAPVSIQNIARKSLLCHASAVIVVHCHPSGVLSFSKSDRELTSALYSALKTIQVKLLDHLIVTSQFPTEYFSFEENHLLGGLT